MPQRVKSDAIRVQSERNYSVWQWEWVAVGDGW